MHGEVLASVDLDLHTHAYDRREGRVEAVVEREATMAGLPLRLAEPRVEDRADLVDERPDRASVALHEVDVLGVATGRIEEELVQRGAAAKARPALPRRVD